MMTVVERTLVERAARRDRVVIAAGLVTIVVLSWAWIVPMARDMYGPMTGPSAWMMTGMWNARFMFLLWCMWSVMMVAMMLPSASPMLLLYATVVRNRSSAGAAAQVYAMAGGYLLAWGLFSLAAVVLQGVLSALLLVTPMMETATPLAAGVLLLAAGIYQFTPLKAACLRSCRSPLSFITQHWRTGGSGAFRMGFEHGLYCVGCCWALMLLLFVGGVMNLWVIIALTIVVLVEKLAAFGAHTTRVTGAALIGLGGWTLVR